MAWVGRWRDEVGDTTALGVVRVVLGVLLFAGAVRSAVELKSGYFGDVFHWPLLPEALVPPRGAYTALVVTQLGLMYTTFDSGGDPVLVPNSAVLAAAVRPLREPEAVSLRARLRDGRTPIELQQAIEQQLTVPIRRHPRVVLEEVDGSEVVVTITVAPRAKGDGGRLASELLEVVARETGDQPAR